jgi:hypothetical protein
MSPVYIVHSPITLHRSVRTDLLNCHSTSLRSLLLCMIEKFEVFYIKAVQVVIDKITYYYYISLPLPACQ